MKKTFKAKKFTAVFSTENGYFSLTGEIDGSSGAVGDRIAEIDSDFELLNAVHLADVATGVPMHAWANAEYHMKQGKIDSARASLGNVPADLFDKWRHALAIRDLHKNNPTPPKDFYAAVETMKNVEEEIKAFWATRAAEVLELVESMPVNLSGCFIMPDDLDELDFDEPEKAVAVAMEEDCPVEDVEEDGDTFTACGCDYLVYTDDEADAAWETELDNYLEECVLPELSDNLARYFDNEAWKRDARQDGRGHSLSRYDGQEREQVVNGTYYYLYKN